MMAGSRHYHGDHAADGSDSARLQHPQNTPSSGDAPSAAQLFPPSSGRHPVMGMSVTSIPEPPPEEPADLPQWVADAPALFRVPLVFFVYSLLLQHDDFNASLRKIGVGAAGPIGFTTMALVFISSLMQGTLSQGGVGVVTAHVLAGFTAMVYAIPWLFLKRNRKSDAAAVDMLFAGITFSIFAATICDVTFGTWSNFGVIAAASLLLRSERAGFFIFLSLVGYGVSAYNALLLVPQLPIDSRLAALPDPLVRMEFKERLVTLIAPGVFFIALAIIIQAQMQEAVRRDAKTSASVTVASTVADALARYDTTLAQRHLDEARDDGAADGALIARLELIVANLDRYRPHLPNWVLTIGDGDNQTREPSEHSTERNDGRRSSHCNEDSPSDAADPEGRRSQHQSNSELSRAEVMTQYSVYGARSPALDALAGPRSPSLLGLPFKARVALAEVAFAIPSASELRDARGLPDVAAAVPLMAAAGHAFVDRVHRLAGGTSGAVHAFVGDVARVSWNAAAKAVQPEAKAARFLARLKHDAGHELVRAWGAAATGDARVQLAGSRQQALLVTASGGGSEALRAGLRVAARHGAFVVDGTTYAGARHAVRFRGCGVTRRTPLNVNRVDEACPLAPDSKNDAANDDIDLDAVEASQLTALSSLHPSALPSSTPPSGPAIAPDRVVVSSPTHRMHAHDVAPMYYLPPRRARIGLFSVVEEEAADSGDWLYVLDPASAGGAKSDAATASARSIDALTCLAVQHAAAGDHAAALELLDDVAHSGTADPMIVEFVAELAAQY